MTHPDFAAAHTVKQSDIPIIDIARAMDGSDLAGVAAQIHAAAINTGFFYISGHGISPALMDQAFTVARDFFALPNAIKESIAINTAQRGWMATGMSKLQGAKTHDLKEVFFWGREVAEDDPQLVRNRPLVARNQWPDASFPRLRDELTPYYDAVCQIAGRVLSAIAISLDQPADFFAPHYQDPLARGQMVYYPPSSAADESEERFGVAPHTDFGVLTFLLQDTSGGLQVRNSSGNWIEAPPIPGTLVCNIGDLLQRWSNDRFASTLHRVINRSGHARYSIPVFFDPNTDTLIDPCDLGVSLLESRHAPVRAGEHIAGRNAKSFAQFQKR